MRRFNAPLPRAALLSVLLVIAGCGGGGDGSGGGGAAEPPPASGSYGWILKAAGPTNALRYGLSLVHPTQPQNEYAIEVASSVVSDARLVSSGTVNSGQLRVASIQPHALVYIVGGDVRSVPMQADGTAPISKVQRAQSTSACRFLIDANDYAVPGNSRFIISTAGADGQCDSADDARAEVRFSAASAPVLTPISGERPLDAVRDPATLAPRGWLYGRSVVLWNGAQFATRAASAPAVSAVVASTTASALVEDGTRLAVLAFPGGSTATETPLAPASTSGNGWQSIGFDADAFYVYRNAGTNFASTWTALRVSRASPAATVLATGSGLVTLASMGQGVLYLTVFGQTDNQLVRIAKTGGTPSVTSTSTTSFTSVQTSASGVHQRWRVVGVGGVSPTYTVEIVDETNAVLYTGSGGFPTSVAESTSRDLNTSESRTSFLFATGYGDRAFSNASLVAYDAASRTPRVLGTLPGTAEFGSDFVFASTIAGPTPLGLAFASRSVNGVVQESGARVASFDVGTAGSLRFTTTVR